MSTWESRVLLRSRGAESDDLLLFMDELYATNFGSERMVESIELQALSPWKNPGDFEKDVEVRLLFPVDDFEDKAAELDLKIELDDARIYLREVDSSLRVRRGVIKALTAPAESSS
jgi:hypothetical protein